MVVPSRHFPDAKDPANNEKLHVFLIEKALSLLPAEQGQIFGIMDLRGFSIENADLRYPIFLFDIFYYYYSKWLIQILFVDAPFVFKPIRGIIKPLVKSYMESVGMLKLGPT